MSSDVLDRPEIKGPEHGLAIALTEERLDVDRKRQSAGVGGTTHAATSSTLPEGISRPTGARSVWLIRVTPGVSSMRVSPFGIL
jgi:hypothetical protein